MVGEIAPSAGLNLLPVARCLRNHLHKRSENLLRVRPQ